MSQKTLLKQVLFGRIQRYIWLCLFLVVFSFLSTFFNHPPKVEAATSGTMNFQARLMQSSGALVPDGYYNVEFKLWDASTGGTNEWTETYKQTNRVRVANGYLTVNLGALNGFSNSINWDQEHWLTMNIGGTANTASPTWDGEMTPRLKLTAVPYAFTAGKLQQTNGGNTSTLDFATQTGSRSILLPDESGTVCLQSSANCGFVTGSAANYLQNTTSPQTADFNITGSGTIGGELTVNGDADFNGRTTFYQSTPTSSPTVLIQGSDGQTSDLLYASNFEANNTLAITKDATLRFKAATGSVNILVSQGASSTSRFELNANGRLSWGDGVSAVDTNLYRSAANTLKTDDALIVSGNGTFNGSTNLFQQAAGSSDSTVYIQGASGQTGNLLSAYDSSSSKSFTVDSNGAVELTSNVGSGVVFNTQVGTQDQFFIKANGTLEWKGLSGNDVNLYRSGVDTLQTDNNFYIDTGSTSAFRIQNTSSNVLFNVDTQNSLVTIAQDADLMFGDSAGISNDSVNDDLRIYNDNGGVYFQTDYFTFQDTTGYHNNFTINNDGQATFSNRTDRTDGFQIQNSTGDTVLNADTQNKRIGIGTDTPKEALHITGTGTKGSKARLVLGDYCSEAEAAALTCTTSGTNIFLGEYYVQGSSLVPLGSIDPEDTDIVQLQGKNGLMFTTGTNANKVNLWINGDGAAVFKNTTNSNTGFQVQDQSGAAVLTADTSANRVLIGSATSPSLSTAKLVVTVAEIQTTLRVGDATNGVSFNDTTTGTSGQLRLYGSARNTKKIVLTPEYAGAVLNGTGVGSMTAGYDSSARKNYYKWTSTQTSNQTYEVVITMPVPSDWSAWAPSNAFVIDGWRSSTADASGSTTIIDTSGSTDANLTGSFSPGSINTWASASATPSGTYVADGMITIRISMTAKNNASFQVGNLTLTYLSKF